MRWQLRPGPLPPLFLPCTGPSSAPPSCLLAGTCAGLSQLTGLTLLCAFNFGGRALAELHGGVPGLRRLQVDSPSIMGRDLAATLGEDEGAGAYEEGASMGLPHGLLPSLTYLSLRKLSLLRCDGRQGVAAAAVALARPGRQWLTPGRPALPCPALPCAPQPRGAGGAGVLPALAAPPGARQGAVPVLPPLGADTGWLPLPGAAADQLGAGSGPWRASARPGQCPTTPRGVRSDKSPAVPRGGGSARPVARP